MISGDIEPDAEIGDKDSQAAEWSKKYGEEPIREDMDKQLEQVGQTSGKDEASPSEERLAGELESASPINGLSNTLEQIEDAPDQGHEWLKSDTGKWYYYIAEGLREYQSGARYQEGKGLVGNPNAQITTENAKELSINGHEAKRQKAIEGMKKAIANKRQLGATIAASADVHEYWGVALGEVMLEPGKNQVAALRLAAEGPLELIGKRNEAASPTNGQVSLTLTGNVSDLRQVMGNRYAQGSDNNNYRKHDDVIDVQVTTPHEDTDTEQNK